MANFPGQGPMDLVPHTVTKPFLAAEAIAKGELVGFFDASTTGYTVGQLDLDDTNKIGIGVAAEAIASGAWGQVIVGGFVPYMVTDGNIAAGSPITATTTAGAAGVGTLGTHQIYGMALAADSGTVCTAAVLYRLF